MKKNIQFLILLISLNSFAQIKAYFLKTNGEVVKGFGNINIQKHQKSTRFYVSKNNDTTIVEFPTKTVFKSFKKNASIFFKDCSELVEKIRKKELKKSNIIEIVEFYNNTCSKTNSRN